MANGGDKFGFHLVDTFDLTDIAPYAQKAGDIALAIAQCGDRQQHRKTNPVFAHVGPLPFIAKAFARLSDKGIKTGFHGVPQLSRQLRGVGDIFGLQMKQRGGLLFDYLFRAVAEH